MDYVQHKEPDNSSLEVENALLSLGFNMNQIRKELSLMDASTGYGH
jgi:Holliday junction resolvasome RuvABC DNA-binding subunit